MLRSFNISRLTLFATTIMADVKVTETAPNVQEVQTTEVKITAGSQQQAKTEENKDLRKKDWAKDVVYLHQFPRSRAVPVMSPFCIKIETFLRAHDIKYEMHGDWSVRSKEGRVPFIELNGEQIADSQIILWHLYKHFNIDDGLNEDQKGMARAIDRMIEGCTYYPITYFRSYEHAKDSVDEKVSGMSLNWIIAKAAEWKLKKNTKDKLMAEGTMLHSREEIVEILHRDIEALSQLLGKKNYLFGTTGPTLADFTLFGHLGLIYYLPFDEPTKEILNREPYHNVRDLLARMRQKYWADDWEQKSPAAAATTEPST